jgi:hypothetical protein
MAASANTINNFVDALSVVKTLVNNPSVLGLNLAAKLVSP